MVSRPKHRTPPRRDAAGRSQLTFGTDQSLASATPMPRCVIRSAISIAQSSRPQHYHRSENSAMESSCLRHTRRKCAVDAASTTPRPHFLKLEPPTPALQMATNKQIRMQRNASMAAGPRAAQHSEPRVDPSNLTKHSRAMLQVNTCDYLLECDGSNPSASSHPTVLRSDDVENAAGVTMHTRMIPASLPINISSENVRMLCFKLYALAVVES